MDMLYYVKLIQRDLDPEAFVIHIGRNNLITDKTSDEIFPEIVHLIKELKKDKKIVIIVWTPPFLKGGGGGQWHYQKSQERRDGKIAEG